MQFNKLKEYLDELVKIENVPGVDCLVYQNHTPVFRYFTGMRDIENSIKTNGKEQYIIFSMTKMITCVAALQLLEKNAYRLEDNLSKYFPEFEKMKISQDDMDTANALAVTSGNSIGESSEKCANGYAINPITIKDLFTMGAGFDYNINSDSIHKAIQAGKTLTRDIVSALSETVLGFEPGTRFRYSLCHDVLGALIEMWSGQKLDEYMYENIFNPLGMNNTYFYTDASKHNSEMAALYTYNEERKPMLLDLDCQYQLTSDYCSGGAGLVSCTEDYAVFLDALACGGKSTEGKRIIKEETVKLMGTNHLNKKQAEDFDKLREGYGYGLGVRVHTDPKRSKSLSPVGEFGWDGAAGAFSLVDTKNKLSLTYFQQIRCWDKKIQTRLRNALYDAVLNA